MTNINQLEPEYINFIRNQKYGTPKSFTKAHSYEELEAYYAGHAKFLAWCVPCGCPCPCNIICWSALFPVALYSCLTSDSDPGASARAVEKLRYVLFPTMIVKLTKKADGEVREVSTLNFLDFEHLDTEIVGNIDDISRLEKLLASCGHLKISKKINRGF